MSLMVTPQSTHTIATPLTLIPFQGSVFGILISIPISTPPPPSYQFVLAVIFSIVVIT